MTKRPSVGQVEECLKGVKMGPVAQRITRLPTEQKIPGSNPGRIVQCELSCQRTIGDNGF